jgi:predicted metal-dependent phosphoesterase TrpH
MDYITITDHDTISGVLEIAHYPEVFISAEYKVFVPEEKTGVVNNFVSVNHDKILN